MSKFWWAKDKKGPWAPYKDWILYIDGKRTDWRLVHCGILGMDLAVHRAGKIVAGPYDEPNMARLEAERLAEEVSR